MRLYAVALITWVATITASSDFNNNANLSEKAVGYTEFRDLSAKQIVQPYVTSIEARSSGQTGTEDHSDDVANAGLSRSAVRVERESSDVSTTDASSPESIYATPLSETTDKHLFRRHPNGESIYTVPEDVLLVENAGRFGQRVRQDYPSDKTIVKTTIDTTDEQKDDEYTSFRKSFSSTVSPLEDGDNRRKPFVSTTREPFVLALKKENSLTDDSLSDDSKVIRFETSTKNSDGSFDTGNTTENSPPDKTNIASILENDVIPENLPKPQARSSRTHNDTVDEITKKPVESTKKSESITRTSTSVVITPSLQSGKFSGPIVVPDLPDRETQEMMIDYLDDNDASATFTSVGNAGIALETNAESTKVAASNGIAMSSIMLNPLQVGITLMNADETTLMDDSEQSAAMDTIDYFQDDLQRLATVDKEFVENNNSQSYVDYKDKNFQSTEKEKSAEIVTQKVPGSSVEIQKSIELYHTAPVHEIHYPPEYIQQTSNLGVIETNNIGNLQRSKQPYDQDEQSELRPNYDIYRGNDQIEKSITKAHASTFSHKFNRHEYNTDVNKPVASTVVAEYSNTQEQTPLETLDLRPLKYNNVQPVLLVPDQFDDTLYDQSNVRHTFNGNDNAVLPHAKFTGNPTRQEAASELLQPYVPYREQQPQSSQPIDDHQHPFRSSEVRRPEAPQLLLRIIPNGSTANGGFVVPIPRVPYPIEKIIEKTVHVPHPIEIEKVIEKKVPFPVERLVEKQVQVPVPQPYPVHVQVPVDRVVEKQIRVPHIYPIHVERTIEKRVPYAIQRLLVQPTPYPLHVRLPAVYPAHVPVHVTAPIEKTTEMSSYRVDVEKPPDNGGSIETKFNRYHQKVSREPVSVGGFAFEPQPQVEANASQFYSVPYGRPLTYNYYNVDVGKSYVPAAHLSNVKLMILPKKFGGRVIIRQHATAPSYAMPASLTRQVVYNLVEKDNAIKDEYMGPAPPRKTSQNKAYSQVKSQFSTSAAQSLAATAALRRARQPETQYPGSFRQSKMEYGFKPPMIPSIQYDEKTASKVEN